MDSETDTMRQAGPEASHATALLYEPAIHELVGAASAATVLLRAIQATDGVLANQSARQGLGWLAGRLADAAENLAALHERRAPRWPTMSALLDVAEALSKASGDARRSARRDVENASTVSPLLP